MPCGRASAPSCWRTASSPEGAWPTDWSTRRWSGAEGPDGVAAHWYGIGKPAARFAADTQQFYSGKQSQRIEITAEHSIGGIGQGEIPIQVGREYAVRWQLRARGSMNVTTRLCDAAGTEYLRQTTRLEQGDWRPWTFNFKAPQTDHKTRLEITFEGPGACGSVRPHSCQPIISTACAAT